LQAPDFAELGWQSRFSPSEWQGSGGK